MKIYKNKNGGFTLIEIIVVLIILGVLAAIALPNLFGNINRSRGAEALASLSPIKANFDGCLAGKGWSGDATSCLITLFSSPNFSAYTLTTGAAGASILATTSLGAGGTITLTRSNLISTGVWSCTGTGVMTGIC